MPALDVVSHSRPWIDEADVRAVEAVVRSGFVAQGAMVERFEQDVTRYLDTSGAVATASGTAALVLALRTLSVGGGAEVILPTYVCESVRDSVIAVGATPVLCDVGPEWVMTHDTVAACVTPRTAAIIAVHIFGLPADVAALGAFGVPVIEDACQAFGVRERGAALGTLGSIGVFSFHATKCLTTGEGGMLVATDPDLISRARALRDGSAPRVAAPMSDLQAALGVSQLQRYDAFVTRRAALRERIRAGLQDAPLVVNRNRLDGFLRVPLRVTGDVASIQAQMAARGIQVRRGVDALLHRDAGLSDDRHATAAALFDTTVSLPFYPALSDDECDAAVGALVACR